MATVIWMRAWPTDFAVALKRTSTLPSGPRSTICFGSPEISTTFGSSDFTVTVAFPPVLSWLRTAEPKNAVSPRARKRGNAGVIMSGLLMRISFCAQPKREALSPATAMMR